MFCSCWFRKSSFTVDSAAARRSRPRRIVAVAEITVGRTVDSTGTEKGKVKRASFVPICVSWVCLAPILFSFHIKSIFAYLSGAKFRTLLWKEKKCTWNKGGRGRTHNMRHKLNRCATPIRGTLQIISYIDFGMWRSGFIFHVTDVVAQAEAIVCKHLVKVSEYKDNMRSEQTKIWKKMPDEEFRLDDSTPGPPPTTCVGTRLEWNYEGSAGPLRVFLKASLHWEKSSITILCCSILEKSSKDQELPLAAVLYCFRISCNLFWQNINRTSSFYNVECQAPNCTGATSAD